MAQGPGPALLVHPVLQTDEFMALFADGARNKEFTVQRDGAPNGSAP
jgi:hypothetical protein